MVRLPVAHAEVFRRRKGRLVLARQAQSGNCHQRASGHAEAGGNFSEHGGGFPLRTGAAVKASVVLTRRLYMQKR